jgi:hypothetical protein
MVGRRRKRRKKSKEMRGSNPTKTVLMPSMFFAHKVPTPSTLHAEDADVVLKKVMGMESSRR